MKNANTKYISNGLGWGWALYVGCEGEDARLLQVEGGGGEGYAEGCAAWRE